MAHLERLAVETLASIFEYLSPQSALNFALTSKYIHASGKLVAHRYKILHLELDRDPAAQLQAWLGSGETLRSMRHLEISGYLRPDLGDQYDPTDDLIILVRKLAHLKRLTWACQAIISQELLETLHAYHRLAELRIYGFQRARTTAGAHEPAEFALASSPALTVLTATVPPYNTPRELGLACVKRIITHAPNLKFASVIQPKLVRTSMVPQLSQQVQDFQIHSQRSSSLRRLTLDGFELGANNLQEWNSLADLSLLEDLKFSRGSLLPDFFSYAPKVLTNIKSLSLNLISATDDTSAAAESYLSICPPLVNLSLWSWRDSVTLSTILTRHGPSLEVLELHERAYLEDELDRLPDTRRVPTKEEAVAIRESCTRLKSLTIDRERHTRELETELETDEVLQELAAMKLSKLQIYYDLGLPFEPIELSGSESDGDEEDATSGDPSQSTLLWSTGDYIHPFITKLWSTVFKSCSTASHRTLVVKFGEWERKNDHIGAAEKRSMWVAEPHERDDQFDVCVVSRRGSSPTN